MSNSELKHILTNRFDGHTVSPTPTVWSAIEANLDEDDRRRKGLFLWIFDGLAAASVLALIAYSLVNSSTSDPVLHGKTVDNTSTNQEISGAQALSSNQGNSAQTLVTINEEDKFNKPATNEFTFFNKNVAELTPKKDQTPIQPLATIIETNPRDELVFRISLDPKDAFLLPNDVNNDLATSDLSHLSNRSGSHWEIGIDATGFLNSSVSLFSSAKMEPVPPNYGVPSPGADTTTSSQNVRYLELRAFVQRKFGRRLSIGAGISASISSFDYTQTINAEEILTSTHLSHDYWSIGLPIHSHYAFIQKNRWSVHAGGLIQPEFRFATDILETQGAPPAAADPSSMFNSQNIDESYKTFHVGFQPYIGTEFYATSRMKISFQAGYRAYLFRESQFQNLGLNSNYLTATLGVGWAL